MSSESWSAPLATALGLGLLGLGVVILFCGLPPSQVQPRRRIIDMLADIVAAGSVAFAALILVGAALSGTVAPIIYVVGTVFEVGAFGDSLTGFLTGIVSASVGIAAVESRMLPRLRRRLTRYWKAIHTDTASRQSVGVSECKIQRTIAKVLFAGAFSLLPGRIQDEFGDEPIQHFLLDWSQRKRSRWAWAISEIVQVCWVAGSERMRGAWQAVTQR